MARACGAFMPVGLPSHPGCSLPGHPYETAGIRHTPSAHTLPARPPQELATEYSVEPELIFSFYRPLIRGIAPPAAAAAGADAAGGAAGEQQEEEGEIGEMSTSPAGAGKGGAEAMEEDGQLEAGEVAASGALVPPPPPPAPDAAQRWEELEAQVGKGTCVGGTHVFWLPLACWVHRMAALCPSCCSKPHAHCPPFLPGACHARCEQRRNPLARPVPHALHHLLGAAVVRPGGAHSTVRGWAEGM